MPKRSRIEDNIPEGGAAGPSGQLWQSPPSGGAEVRFIPAANAPGEEMFTRIDDASAEGAEPPRPLLTPIHKIREIVFAALADAEGGSDSASAFQRRVEKVAQANPGFAEGYPKLLEVACSATTRERAQSIRSFLPMMLAQMSEISAQQTTFEDASKVVGLALGDKFMPNREPKC
jgi:hypothetical protein